jgi:hypothetical protein
LQVLWTFPETDRWWHDWTADMHDELAGALVVGRKSLNPLIVPISHYLGQILSNALLMSVADTIPPSKISTKLGSILMSAFQLHTLTAKANVF